METKLNIAEILKNKPKGTKLYSPLFGDVYLSSVKDSIINVEHHGGMTKFFDNGRYYNYPESEPLLFPSKEMHDWSKFAWKRGDVLVSEDNVYIIFEKFENDDYTRFKGKHYFWKEGNEEDYSKEETKMLTSVFEKASDDKAQTYINTIEERLGGKLNLETLESEKIQPEFKDGDIITMHKKNCDIVFIFNRWRKKDSFYYYAFHTCNTDNTGIINERIRLPYEWMHVDNKVSPATDSEKQQLFKALAKENKAWDAEKKLIVDLKPKIEFKPFDKVLVRDCLDEMWRPSFFACYLPFGKEPYQVIGGEWVKLCIPYEGNESLLGTTKDVEG